MKKWADYKVGKVNSVQKINDLDNATFVFSFWMLTPMLTPMNKAINTIKMQNLCTIKGESPLSLPIGLTEALQMLQLTFNKWPWLTKSLLQQIAAKERSIHPNPSDRKKHLNSGTSKYFTVGRSGGTSRYRTMGPEAPEETIADSGCHAEQQTNSPLYCLTGSEAAPPPWDSLVGPPIYLEKNHTW